MSLSVIRSRTGLVSRVLLALLTAVATLTVAHPAEGTEPEPSTSPSITRQTLPTSGQYSCPSGTLCAFVLSNSGSHSTYYYFRFVHCQTYYLSHWHQWVNGGSYVIDNQTGGVTTTLYGSAGQVLQRFTPSTNRVQYVNGSAPSGGWEPVYSIRVC